MEKNEKKPNKPLYIVLAILIACALWFYVRSVGNPDQTVTINNIPVTFVGEDVLNASNLMLTSGTDQTVTLRIQGKWNVVSQIRRSNVTIQVNLARITSPGSYRLAYDILWPGNVTSGNVSVLDRNPFYVPVDVSRMVSRPVEVRGAFSGSVAEGYQMEDFVFQPATIEVSGEDTAVAKVAYALVTVSRAEPLKGTIREDMVYTLIGQDGEPIESSTVIAEPSTVNMTLPVTMWKEVPLTVDFVPGGGATAETVKESYTITPATIMLAGSESELAAYSSINLGSIDLSKVIGTGQFRFTIPIGQDVENVSGVQEAKVEVTVSGLKTIMLETENIEIIGHPDWVKATPITQHVQVQIRGGEEALELVLPQYLRVVVDLSEQSLPAGQSVVTAKVYLDGVSGAGVIGEYKVAISLSDSISHTD